MGSSWCKLGWLELGGDPAALYVARNVPNVATVLPQCGPNVAPRLPHVSPKVAPTLPQCGKNVAPMWPQCCPIVAPMWPQCCPSVAPMLPQCGPNVAPMGPQCCPNVAPMLPQCWLSVAAQISTALIISFLPGAFFGVLLVQTWLARVERRSSSSLSCPQCPQLPLLPQGLALAADRCTIATLVPPGVLQPPCGHIGAQTFPLH